MKRPSHVMPIVFVMGANGTGKSTLLSTAKEIYGDDVHLIEVGKWLRAKYSPSYFDGLQAPSKTEEEAWEMMVNGIREVRYARPCPVVLVDGQPRRPDAASKILHHHWFREQITRIGLPHVQKMFVHLYADRDERWRRLTGRDSDDPEKLKLSQDRLTSDMIGLYEVLSQIGVSGGHVRHLLTTGIAPQTLAIEVVRMANSMSP